MMNVKVEINNEGNVNVFQNSPIAREYSKWYIYIESTSYAGQIKSLDLYIIKILTMFVYMYISKVKLATIVKGDPRAPFSIAYYT